MPMLMYLKMTLDQLNGYRIQVYHHYSKIGRLPCRMLMLRDRQISPRVIHLSWRPSVHHYHYQQSESEDLSVPLKN
jgi:hypothetical protein